MESKDKMIGLVLIIVGIFFIALGVFVNMNTGKVKQTTNVYQEQVVDNTIETNNENDNSNTNVNVYTETDVQTTDENTRYIY